MFEKILIANRGEIAVRIIHACREMGIRTVAIYSEADTTALHVRLADEAVCVGAAPSSESYLRIDRIIEAALETNSQAIHPGYGFLSEAEAFAEAVQASGLVFIGPSPQAIRSMGSKTEARALMQAAGVPVVPGFQGWHEDFPAEAEKIGYPVMVKAAAGGGGKGIRIVHQADDLAEAVEAARHEAKRAFDDDTLFLEKYLPVAHHIEFQILADVHGNTVHLFERECSIQRRHQKIIEETPSPLMTEDLRAEMGAAAVAAAHAIGYVNAGTVEFIVDEARHFYFLEMNTRLQVEHPITEMVTGVDLVRLQIQIAAGERLPFSQGDLRQRGHAIECRIYAEDPTNDFLPATGTIWMFDPPRMPNVRLDAGIETGDTISIHYDPMIAKLIVYDSDRHHAIRRMATALRETIILGITTNIPFLEAVMAHEVFQAGNTTTNFIDQHIVEWGASPLDQVESDIAFVTAALIETTPTRITSMLGRDHSGDVYSPWNEPDGFRMGRG
jgi:acetyl-CoA carboxylase biotin carboxylase subunit